MVRTPLARRIEADASLNDVHLYLPHYNQEAVNAVIDDLKDVENVPPSETGTVRELVILNRQEGLEDVFDALKELVTYQVNAVRKQSALRRLMGLGRGLTQDRVDEEAQKRVKGLIVDKMTEEIEELRGSGILERKLKYYRYRSQNNRCRKTNSRARGLRRIYCGRLFLMILKNFSGRPDAY